MRYAYRPSRTAAAVVVVGNPTSPRLMPRAYPATSGYIRLHPAKKNKKYE